MFVIYLKGYFIDHRYGEQAPTGSFPIALYDAEKGVLTELTPLPKERVIAYIQARVIDWVYFWQTEADLIGTNNAVKRVLRALDNITVVTK